MRSPFAALLLVILALMASTIPTASATIEENADYGNSSFAEHTVRCGGFKKANANSIQQGIEYLRKVHGQPTRDAGPNNCDRVSCSYRAAIWWCNDDTKPRTLPSFNNIADGAQVIQNKCRNYEWTSDVSGELDHPDKWRVQVKYDKHSC